MILLHNMSTSLTFSRIINPTCSCGNYVGRHQPAIELDLVRKHIDNPKVQTNDIDVAEIITKMGIYRMCCRNTIIVSPILRLMTTDDQFKIYFDEREISQRMNRIIVGNNNPEI